MEILVLLSFPLLGGLWLGVTGQRARAPQANLLFSLATLGAAAFLAMRVLREGRVSAWDEQFVVDPFNVFLVGLTAFVGMTTAWFSRPYPIFNEMDGNIAYFSEGIFIMH